MQTHQGTIHIQQPRKCTAEILAIGICTELTATIANMHLISSMATFLVMIRTNKVRRRICRSILHTRMMSSTPPTHRIAHLAIVDETR